MKFLSTILALAFAAKANAEGTSEQPCLAECVQNGSGEEICIFEVSRDQFASELGYFKFSGANGDCGGTNPTLGVKKGATYYFKQADVSNYYHALGFAYGEDGALAPNDELEPGIVGPGSTSTCNETLSCPAPMYIKDNKYLGNYSNIESIEPVTEGLDNFGLDDYEPEFFYPVLDWLDAGLYEVALHYPVDNDFSQDFFYFCHIHEFMTGRIKFVDDNGNPTNPVDFPPITYDYQVPSDYDLSCGTFGLDEFQLPNAQCPETFVCDAPGGAVGQFADCVDSMNCAMMNGMTTNVNTDNAICLFNHQMIPHHQNAINMCKALLKSGEADCEDLTDEESQACIINVICQEIINTQNAQIQTMRGVLEELKCDKTDDCRINIESDVLGECEDDASFRFKGKKDQDCVFFADQIANGPSSKSAKKDKSGKSPLEKQCGKKSKGQKVSDACPVTCGMCKPDESFSSSSSGSDDEGSDDATEAPVAATEAPVAATEAPVAATEAPVATRAPVDATTKAPVAATEAPVAATEAPVDATEAPVDGTAAPVVGVTPTKRPTRAPVLEDDDK